MNNIIFTSITLGQPHAFYITIYNSNLYDINRTTTIKYGVHIIVRKFHNIYTLQETAMYVFCDNIIMQKWTKTDNIKFEMFHLSILCTYAFFILNVMFI